VSTARRLFVPGVKRLLLSLADVNEALAMWRGRWEWLGLTAQFAEMD
jgi:hypothetical protein